MRVDTLLCFAASTAATPLTTELAPKAFSRLPLGSLKPQGWLLEQLVRQANSLSGYMSKSTFPGASTVNESVWVGGNFSYQGSLQWFPYWSNGNVPLVALIRAAGAADRLVEEVDLANSIDGYMQFVLEHTNKTNGWIGPYTNEPGDKDGMGLWSHLNMLRSLMMWGEDHAQQEPRVAAAVIAHITQTHKLLHTDPVIDWASTRWPTFVEICQRVEDLYLAKYGADPDVMPLGEEGTQKMLREAAAMFSEKGMDWASYYHQTGGNKFPESDVKYPNPGWNQFDHGVNNMEGALNWPAVTYRMTGNSADAEELPFALSMIDKYQGQFNSMLCADEILCGREPHRGTETCAIVEAMASLEHSFTVFGNATLMDRVERLAFNAMPAALTDEMWGNVYVQQANSVFAGRTQPTPWPAKGKHCGREVGEDLVEQEDSVCQSVGDTPSDEDQNANFFGIINFPCCMVNFPQGWPKFAMHAILAEETAQPPAAVIGSLVPAAATMPSSIGGGATVVTDTQYPFTDVVTFRVHARAPMQLKMRIPGWADRATLNGTRVQNGTFVAVRCAVGETVLRLDLQPEIRTEYGWGPLASSQGPAANGVGIARGPLLFAFHPREEVKATRIYNESKPFRPKAVDLEISTSDTWNYALVPSKGLRFDASPSRGWTPDFAFDRKEFPFQITATARVMENWGFWKGSMITDELPHSPVECAADDGCGEQVELRLVPFGGTHIRISVFPWLHSESTTAIYL